MMKGNDLIDLLRQVKEVLGKHNIEFWLDCGTLLGAVREGKFLPWEYDIDLGAWYDDFPDNVKKSISNKLCAKNLEVYIFRNYMNIRKRLAVLDINFYHLHNSNAIYPQLKDPICKFLNYFSHILQAPWNYQVCNEKSRTKRFIRYFMIGFARITPFSLRKQIAQILSRGYGKNRSGNILWIVPNSYFLDLSTIKFYGMEFKAPAKAREYLTYRYGKDWRIPRKNWVTSRDDGAIINSLG